MKPTIRQTKPGVLSGLTIVNAYTLIGLTYCATFSLLYYFLADNTFLAILHGLAFLSVAANYIILKRTRQFERTDMIMTIGTIVVVCMFASGGWESTGFLWPFAFLPFVFFLSDPGKSIYWIVGLVAGCAISAGLQLAGIIQQPYTTIALFNFFACLTVFMACNYFIKRKAINYEEVLNDTRNLLESSIDPFFTIDRDGRIKDVNKSTEKITGIPSGSLRGSRFSTYFTDQDKAKEMCEQVFTEGMAVNVPLVIRREQGEPLELLFNAVLYRDEKGRFQSMFAIGRDITERRKLEIQLRKFNEELEEQVRVKTTQLSQKAAELEQFAYFASHDLQEPLNTTTGFIRLLRQKYEGKLEKDADQYFTFILQASDRMKTLIRELLEYSRWGVQKERQPVDCNKVLSDVLADLGHVIVQQEAVIEADNLPVIDGYPVELKILFQNLLTNAIKFRQKDKAPALQITVDKKNGHWQFAFRDNGIGIDPAHHNRIFHLFRRLHNRAEYEGTGIGLAHCRKIVELHGGTIWVESAIGKGSVFYFTIQAGMGASR